MTKNKKKIKKIIVLIIICIISIIGLVLILNQLKKESADADREEYQKFREEYEAQTILPRKIYELYNYEGALERDYLYKHMKTFVDYIDYLKKNINETNMIDFYEKNKDEIKDKTGIKEQSDFENLILAIKNENVDAETFKYAEIEAGSSYTENKYFYFNIFFYYGESENPLTVKIGLSTLESADVKVKYKIINL